MPIIHFVIFTLLNCPPNFLWQQYLEQRFPGYTGPSSVTKGEKRVAVKKKLDVGNTIKKLALDQTVGATVNTVLFTAVIGSLKGLGGGDIVDAIKQVSSDIRMKELLAWVRVIQVREKVVRALIAESV